VDAFDTSDATYWNPVQSGESVEGVYTKKIEGVITKFGTMDYMEIVQVTGKTVRVGISSGLTHQIARLNLYDDVKIEYLGQAYNKNTKRRYNDFAVYRAIE
jgi:sRNA-binding carbon storage regulator CsrA